MPQAPHEAPLKEWDALGRHWQSQVAGLEISPAELHGRLRRQRSVALVLTAAELLSLAVVLSAAVWMSHLWLKEPGASPILIVFLMLPTGIVLGQRWRQRTQEATRGLEDIDATIAREEQLLQSLRLASVMSQLALAAMILVVVARLFHHRFHQGLLLSSASTVTLALLYLYVFGLQIALIAWARRVRRQKQRLEAVRHSLMPPRE